MPTDSCDRAKNSRQTVSDARLLRSDLLVFYRMISAFQELVLSMVRNAAFALPDGKNSALPSSKMHEIVNKKNFSYNRPITTREVILFCMPQKSRHIYDKLIRDIVVKNNKIAIKINQKELAKFDKRAQVQMLKSLLVCSEIMNITNRDFQHKLPEAKQQGRALIKSIKPRRQIPQKARCKRRKIDK